MREGVTRFVAHHESAAATRTAEVAALCAVRARLVALGVVGADPARYEGVGFGNASVRDAGEAFHITGTQTGALPALTAEHIATVTRSRPETNEVWSRGPIRPSSESMTHAVVYATRPFVRAVLHGHDPGLWRSRTLPETPAAVAYGTPEMAAAVRQLLQQRPDCTAFAMAGHEDGVVVLGESLDDAVAHFEAISRAAR